MEFDCDTCGKEGAGEYLSHGCFHVFCEICKSGIKTDDCCPVCKMDIFKLESWREMTKPGGFETQNKVDYLKSRRKELDSKETEIIRELDEGKKRLEKKIRSLKREHEEEMASLQVNLEWVRQSKEVNLKTVAFIEQCGRKHLKPKSRKGLGSQSRLRGLIHGEFTESVYVDKEMGKVLEFKFTLEGELNGRRPRVEVNSKGHYIVCESMSSRIKIFDNGGKLLGMFGEDGYGPNQIHNPSSVAVDRHDNIYICDQGNNRIQVFDPLGDELLKTLGGRDSELFDNPSLICISRNTGNLLVKDMSSRIQVFDGKLEMIKSETIFESRVGTPPNHIHSMAINDRNEIVLCWGKENRFYLSVLKGDEWEHVNSNLFYSPAYCNQVQTDFMGRCYVSTKEGHLIYVYDEDMMVEKKLEFTVGVRPVKVNPYDGSIIFTNRDENTMYVYARKSQTPPSLL